MVRDGGRVRLRHGGRGSTALVAGMFLALVGQAGGQLLAESRDRCAWQGDFQGAQLDGVVWALSTFDDGSGPALYAGGELTTAGGLDSSFIAAWTCPSEVFIDDFEDGGTAAWTLTVP